MPANRGDVVVAHLFTVEGVYRLEELSSVFFVCTKELQCSFKNCAELSDESVALLLLSLEKKVQISKSLG